PLVVIDGKINGKGYQELLRDNLLPFLNGLGDEMNKSDVGQIHDFFNEMSSEEIKCFKIKQAKLSVASSPWYPP
ncbi:15085_t:CDS:2, partial [Entrophospora sp. SA101]